MKLGAICHICKAPVTIHSYYRHKTKERFCLQCLVWSTRILGEFFYKYKPMDKTK
jgi:hypothetical protein